MSSASPNLKQILSEVWNAMERDRYQSILSEHFTEDYVSHGGSGTVDLEGFIGLLREFQEGFPDLETGMLDLIEEGDRVAYRWVTEGTHLGTFLGALPTGRRIRAEGIIITRFEGDKIAEDWSSWNEVTVLHDLGILPIDRG
ncbi:ester cyclase [Gulosibacter molinativorax]|uniref:Ester cyclase n=1 Tax=Gulosibacter molinativorax TaxID=256821 RepID=A0ABT7CC35_9MICO|nr:ester cyclase [Gulosibacter molinativorax]MDJ1372705.1 ester cyclase [Gulosibacter molinativorax]QUY63184.1 Hypotetical protein [Gulosibacter molinativorax]